MRVRSRLKFIFYASFLVLYFSGTLSFFLHLLRPEADGPGIGETWALHFHGMVGLWFLVLYGHFFHAHIWPSLRGLRHRRSGILTALIMSLLCLSVPFLYYLSEETWRSRAVVLHTYAGLFAILPILLHVGLAIRERR